MRLAKHDYASRGWYFVTMCVIQREPLFDIPELQTIVRETWYGLSTRFATITLDEFVIIPNHVHGLLWLAKDTPDAPTLGKVIGVYKSLTTVLWLRHLKTTNTMIYPGCFWQSRYYDRIIRDESDLEQTRHYIRNNPLMLDDNHFE